MGFLFEYQAGDQEAAQLVFTEEQKIVQFREDFQDLQDATQQAYRYNGWIAEEGTPLKVALANAQEADAEIETRRYNAAVGAQTLREKGVESRLQGQLNEYSHSNSGCINESANIQTADS